MPAENLTLQAYWVLSSLDSTTVQSETDAILDKIDPSIIEGKDVEITVRIEVQPQETVLPGEVDLVNQTIQSALDMRRAQTLFIDIEVILKEAGLDDVLIELLLEPLSITITIPEEHRGFRNYHVIRIHNGVATVLETDYHQDNQTLTFETDRFSTYAIAYDTQGECNLWWLLLLLLLPIAYLVYRWTRKPVSTETTPPIVQEPILVASQEEEEEQKEEGIAAEPKEEAVRLDDVVLKNIEDRPQFKAFEHVDNGEYLEVTTDLESSNRVVEVSTGVLPKLINPENAFVPLEKEESSQFKNLHLNLTAYHRLTPGSYAEAGYYMEVDLDSQPVDNFVHSKRRLPPTSAKGHRWVRIEPRKIKSE